MSQTEHPSTKNIVLRDIGRSEAAREFAFSFALWEISVKRFESDRLSFSNSWDSRSRQSGLKVLALLLEILSTKQKKLDV